MFRVFYQRNSLYFQNLQSLTEFWFFFQNMDLRKVTNFERSNFFFNSYLGLWYGEVWKKFKNSFYFQKLQVWLNFEFNMELQKITKFGPFKNILNYAIFHSHLCHKKCRDKNGSDLAQSKWLEESVKILASSDRYFWGRAGGQMIIILIRKFLLYLRSFWGWL